MSARAAVYEMLTTDEVLAGFGIGPESVFTNASLDVAPRMGHFLVLRWENEELAFGRVGHENLTVWSHIPRQVSTDYIETVAILNRVTSILTGRTHVEGIDGVFTAAHYQGMSGDFNDEVLKTIVKNAAYRVLSRPATVE